MNRIMTTTKPMTGEQLDELMAVAVRMQRDAEVDCNYPSANFAYAVQVAVLELRRTRDVSVALAAENAAMKEWSQDRAIIDDALEQENYTSLKIDWRQRSLRNIKTPATDAFLAEVRASGVEKVIAYHHERSDALAEVDRDGSFRHLSAAMDATDVLMKIRQEAAK